MKSFVITLPFLLMIFSCAVFSENRNEVETMTEVSIIGNAELPNKVFDLSWRLPSVEKRENQLPPKQLTGMLKPLEPFRYRQQIHFSRYLEVDTSNFSAR